jgi:hypothetical protein
MYFSQDVEKGGKREMKISYSNEGMLCHYFWQRPHLSARLKPQSL